jgi:hypothetical protein
LPKSIKPSVRNPNNQKDKAIGSVLPIQNRRQKIEMRDLYNRKEKLIHWIQKAKTELNEPDKTHVLQFVQYMQEKDNSILWIVRCITALIYIRRQLNKPFIDCKKESEMLTLAFHSLDVIKEYFLEIYSQERPKTFK